MDTDRAKGARSDSIQEQSQLADEAAISVLLLAFTIFSGLTGLMLLFRKYAERQRARGRTTLCFGCIELGEGPGVVDAHQMVAADRGNDSLTTARRELVEESSIAALELLPIDHFHTQGQDEEVECSLCMVGLQEADVVRKLPCGHMFHVACVDRWLIESQKHQRRRCPLCNSDPIAAMQVVCPPGVAAGSTIQLKQPNGNFNVTVPAGVHPGDVFHVHLPAAIPTISVDTASSCTAGPSDGAGDAAL